MRPHGWIALGLLLATAAVFYPALDHEFVGYDDHAYIVQNASLRDVGTSDGLRGVLQPHGSNWIPLTFLSFQLDYALHGLDPRGYHATNVALHGLAALLLYAALFAMTGAAARSAVVAAIFAVHPLHVESVAWATERKDTLSGVFFMLTLLAYAYARRAPGSRTRSAWVCVCLALGLLAKPMLVTLPLVLLLLDDWPLGRLRAHPEDRWPDAGALRAALLEKLPLFALVALASLVTYWAQHASGSVSALEALPLGARIQNALDAYVIYPWKTLWPTHLAVFYPHPRGGIPLWRSLAEAILLLAVSFAAQRSAARRPYLRVGWLWYLGTLVPVIGIIQVGMQARADRYMYLPLIGLSIAGIWGLADFARRWQVPRTALAAFAATALLALGMTASQQLETWRNTESLFRRALEVTDDNYLAHLQLGNAMLREARFEQAAQHFAEASRLAPQWSLPRLGLADVALARGRIEEALQGYQRELRRDPDDAEASGRYGIALGMAGRHAEAREALLRALRAQPGMWELHLSLSISEAALGDTRAALAYAREALRLAPHSAEAANGLAWTLATTRDPELRNPEQAIQVIEALARDAGDAWLLDTLAAAYAAAGRFDAAIATAQQALTSAERADQRAEAESIRGRLALYRSGLPYLEPARAGEGAQAP